MLNADALDDVDDEDEVIPGPTTTVDVIFPLRRSFEERRYVSGTESAGMATNISNVTLNRVIAQLEAMEDPSCADFMEQLFLRVFDDEADFAGLDWTIIADNETDSERTNTGSVEPAHNSDAVMALLRGAGKVVP